MLKSAFVTGMLAPCAQAFSMCPLRATTIHNGFPLLDLKASRLQSTPLKEDPLTSIDDSTNIEEDDDSDELVDSLTEKLEEMEGLWYSDDFYGPHGREWVQISAKLSLADLTATTNLVAVKVTGDPNVPAGCVTFQTKQWPGMGETVGAQIQVRADPTDPDGFSWMNGELTLIAKDEIRLMCQYNVLMKSEGTFYKQNNEEEGDNNSH